MKRRVAHFGIVGKLCDCPRDRQSKCHHSYYFDGGREYRFSVDVQMGRHIASWGEAVELGTLWLQQIAAKTFMRRNRGETTTAATKDGSKTLAEFVDTYIRDGSMLKPRKQLDLKDRKHRDFYVLQPLLQFTLPDGRMLKDVAFHEVTKAMYEQYVADRREREYAASTVNKDITLIKEMCDWGADNGWYGKGGVSPLAGKSKVLVRKEQAQRQRPIAEAEFDAMSQVCDWHLWAYIRLSVITCARLTELYRFRWSDLQRYAHQDHEGWGLQVRLEATKAGARMLPLDEEGLKILARLRVDPSGRRYPDDDYIMGEFGEEPRSIKDRFKTMLLKAFPAVDPAGERIGIDWQGGVHGPAAQQRLAEIDLLFSDFRHEGALLKLRAGWLMNEIQALLGHSNLKQTSTYLGVPNEAVLRAMAVHGSGAKVPVVDPLTHRSTNLVYQSKPIREVH